VSPVLPTVHNTLLKALYLLQLAAVQQESMYQQQYALPHVPSEPMGASHVPLDSAVVAVEKMLTSSLRPENGSVATTQSISARLAQRYFSMATFSASRLCRRSSIWWELASAACINTYHVFRLFCLIFF